MQMAATAMANEFVDLGAKGRPKPEKPSQSFGVDVLERNHS
jgi:hypothetical protein